MSKRYNMTLGIKRANSDKKDWIPFGMVFVKDDGKMSGKITSIPMEFFKGEPIMFSLFEAKTGWGDKPKSDNKDEGKADGFQPDPVEKEESPW